MYQSINIALMLLVISYLRQLWKNSNNISFNSSIICYVTAFSLSLIQSHSVPCITGMLTAKQWKSFSLYNFTLALETADYYYLKTSLGSHETTLSRFTFFLNRSPLRCFVIKLSYFVCYKLTFLAHSLSDCVFSFLLLVPKSCPALLLMNACPSQFPVLPSLCASRSMFPGACNLTCSLPHLPLSHAALWQFSRVHPDFSWIIGLSDVNPLPRDLLTLLHLTNC